MGLAKADAPSAIAAEFTAAATPGNTAYRIGPQDLLDVSVFKVPELTRSVQVSDTGTVNMPLVGDVPAAGKTANELEHMLAARLGASFLQNPQVTVLVREYNSQRVTVEGAVKKPGVLPVRGKSSLMQIIAMSDGLDREVAASNVVVFRTIAGKREAARFDIDDIQAGKAADPTIQAGDIIVVDTSTAKLGLSYFTKALPAASLFRPF